MLNCFFRGGVEGVEGEAYDCLVVGVGVGESGWKGFELQVNGGLSWGLFEEKVGELKEGQGRNLLGGGGEGSMEQHKTIWFWVLGICSYLQGSSSSL